MTVRVVVHAPNVHTGGGLVLLRALLARTPSDLPMLAFLDHRAKAALPVPAHAEVHWVDPSLPSRWRAERELARRTLSTDRLLCFHGLPPLWPAAVPAVVFLQNRLLIENTSLSSFSRRTALRLRLERLWSRWRRHGVGRYLVQTPAMAAVLHAWLGTAAEGPPVRLLPFVAATPAVSSEAAATRAEARAAPEWDFVYVADGEAHKNHERLVEAWCALARQQLRPSLALTLGAKDEAVWRRLAPRIEAEGLRVHNLGTLPHQEVRRLYERSRALIFPSLAESFGLPLLEARQAGLPIVAGELDFVRDVCEPVQTFDPRSAVSIARAVRRFLGQAQPPLDPLSAEEAWRVLLSDPPAS